MKKELVAVVDLGSTKVACLAARADEKGDLRIEALATAPCKGLRRGVVADLEETSRAFDVAIRRLQSDVAVEIPSVVLGVSGPHIDGQSLQGFKPIVPRSRHITHQDVLEVLNHSRQMSLSPDREQIQAVPREFRIDGVRDIRQPIGMSGGKLEVVTFIATAQTTALQNLERAVGMAGKKVDQYMLRPLAAGIGVLTEEEIQLGATVVDIGAGTTDIAVFVNGSIAAVACLPLGSSHITSDISKLLKTTPEEAERLKLSFGSAVASQVPERNSVDVMQLGQTIARPLQRRVLCEIIEARLREMAVMVRQQIEKAGLYGVLPGGLVLTGGGAQLPDADRLFESVLAHVKVRVAEPTLPSRFAAVPGLAAVAGMARFTLQCADEIAPAQGPAGLRGRVKTLFSLISGK